MTDLTQLSPRTLFYQGRCEELLAQTVDHPEFVLLSDDVSYIIGALCFMGRVDEADYRVRKLEAGLSLETRAACYFYLTVGWTRCSLYAKARHYIVANLLLIRRRPDIPLATAYARQGQAFYRHFCGRYKLALTAAERALHAAMDANDFFIRMIATDLLGHIRVEMGEIARGLHELELAHRLAEKLGHGSHGKAIFKAIMSYRIQYGLLQEDNLSILQELIQESRVQDTYTDNYMILELVRQLTVRGRVTEAETWLELVSRAIYASRHRRQQVLMNLRWAEIAFQKGESEMLAAKLELAQADIDSDVDLALRVYCQGLSIKAGLENSADFLAQHRRDTLRLGSGIALRIYARNFGLKHTLANGDDPLGDVIDAQSLHPGFSIEQFKRLVKSGYLSRLRSLLPATAGKAFIYYNPAVPNLVLGRSGDLFCAEIGTSSKLFELLKALHQGHQTKEDLVRAIWAYEYNSLRHDSLLYTLISRFRILLGTCSDWLLNDEEGYTLAREVKIILEEPRLEPRSAAASPPAIENALNARQWAILDWLKKVEKTMSADDCAEQFQVSKVTATRDLSGLFKSGFIQRQGKGPSTCYRLNAN